MYTPNNRQKATHYFWVNNFNTFLLRSPERKMGNSLTLIFPETQSTSACLHRQTALPSPIARYSGVTSLLALHCSQPPRWTMLGSTYKHPVFPLHPGSQSPPKINNSSQDIRQCCYHARDLVHTSLMLLLPPQEILQIDPQDPTPCSYFSWAATDASL